MILMRKQLAPVGGAVSRAFSIQFELRLGKNTARENPETGFRELELGGWEYVKNPLP